MKKIVCITLLSALFSIPACATAADLGLPTNIGVNYSFDDTFGTHFEFNVSQYTNNHAPISIQAFWKNYQQNVGTNASWNTTGTGLAALYDLSSFSKLDKKYHPYAGLGLIAVSYSWSGIGPSWKYSGVNSGLYVTGGVRYTFNPVITGDLSYNSFGGLTLGANFNF